MSLICPTTSIRIVDAANRPLPPKSLIPVDQLGGVTLRVVQPDHRAVAVYEIDNWQFLETTHLTKLGSVSELNLSSISTYAAGVLAQSDDPDSKVKFGVVLGNTSTPVFEWSVSRYSRYLKKDDQDIERGISVDSTFFSLPKDFAARLKEDHDEVVLDVLPMHAVSQPMPKASIASTGDGVFRIDHADYQPGYYLIVGHTKNSGETVRPIRLAVKPNTIPRPDMKDLLPSEKFSAVLNLRSRYGRKLAWADFCGELGGDLAHPAWENVDEILNISKSLSLPITTFEVLAQLASTPEAIVRTAFVRHSDVWFWESMEQIPFLWSLVPTAHWIKGAYRSIEFVSKTLNNVATDPVEIEKLIATQIRMFAESAPIRVRGLASVLPALRDAGIDVPIQVLGQHYDRNPVGSRDIEMARLIKQHEKYGARHSLPEIRLMLAELVHEKLRCIVDLTIQDRISNGWSVLNAPAIAAIHCMYDLVAPVELVCQLKRLRGIDPEWFSIANASAMQMIFEHRMREDPTCFSRLSDTVK